MSEPPTPKCVASTGPPLLDQSKVCRSEKTGNGNGNGRSVARQPDFFREARFSGDGTTIVTHSNNHHLNTFILPPELLNESEKPHELKAVSTFVSPSPIQSYAIHPHFNLQHWELTARVLYAPKDLPISLRSAWQYDTVAASYPSVNSLTEAYLPTTALEFSRDGFSFIAGSHNRLEIFDVSRDGSGPVRYHKTAGGKNTGKLLYAPSSTCKGVIGALSISKDGTLAAGTMSREVALYGNEGYGECITSFSLERTSDRKDAVNGTGITHLRWSPCGTYLLIAERQSEGIQVYDVRMMMRRVSLLNGRQANTTQRMAIDVLRTFDGYEVWGGGTDGSVRRWSNPGQAEGEIMPDLSWKLHDDAVPSAVWHPTCCVLATCSGQRTPYGQIPGLSDDEASDIDSVISLSSGESDDNDDLEDEPIRIGEDGDEADDSETRGSGIRRKQPDTSLKVWTL